jgi:general secretion pathway protein C
MKLPERLDLSRLSWPRAARLGPVVAWSVALAITAWVAADLFWRFSAPKSPALPVASLADPQRAAQSIASRHLMGQTQAASQAAAPAAPGRYALQAAVTGAGKRPGWAVIAIDGGAQQGFVEGQEIRPGVTLAAVHGDSVELSIGGARQTVRLAEYPGTGGTAPNTPPPPSVPNVSPPDPSVQTMPSYFPSPGGDSSAAVDPEQRPAAAGIPVRLPARPSSSLSNQ